MRVMAKGQVQRKATSLNEHALLSSLAMHSPPRSHSDQRVADAIRVAPYLTHVVRHHGQLTLIPPENAGRVRREKREKSRPRSERPARSNEEPHFNTGVSRSRRGQPASPASRARRQIGPAGRQNSAEGDILIPDYPPPSFDEAISTAPVPVPAAGGGPAPGSPAAISPAPSSPVTPEIRPPPSPSPIEQGSSRGSAVRRSPSPPAAGPSTAHAPRTPSRLAFATPDPGPDPDGPTPSPSVRYSTQAEYNSSEFSDSESNPDSDSSLEFMSIVDAPEGASQWEQDRLLGLPLEERIARENQRQQKRHLSDVASSIFSRAIRPSRSQLTIVPTKHNAELERQEREDELSPSSPSAESPLAMSQQRNASPSPPRSSKRRLHFFSSSNRKDREPSSLPSSPTFSTSQLSLPLHSRTYPSSPGSKPISGQRGEGFISRRIFGGKGKEKEKEKDTRPEASSSESLTSEPLDSWEVLDRSWQPEARQKQLTGPVASTSAGPSTAVRGRARDSELVLSEQSPPPPAASSAVAAPSRIPGPVRPKRHSMHDRPAPPPPVPAVAQVQLRRPPPPPPPPPHAAPRSPTLPMNTEEDEPDAPPATPDNEVPQEVDLQRSLSRQPGDQQLPRELKPSASMVWVRGRENPNSDSTTRTQPATVVSAARLPSPVDASRLSPVSTRSAATYIEYNPGSPPTPTTQYFLDADGVLRRGTPIPVSRLQLADPNPPPVPQHGPADGLPHAHAIQHHNSQPNLMQSRVEAVSLEHAARTYSQQYTPSHAFQPQVSGTAPDRRNGTTHLFAPPNPSPLAGYHRPGRTSPERQASASDADSPLDLYDQASAPANAYTPPRVHSSPALSPVAEAGERERADTAGGRHHYPGRPLPQPPGGSSSAGPALPPAVPALPMSDEKLPPLDDDDADAEPPYSESLSLHPSASAGAGPQCAAANEDPGAQQPAIEAFALSLPPSPPIQSQEHRFTSPAARTSRPALALPAPQSRAPAASGLLHPPAPARGENRTQTPVESSTPSVYEDPRAAANGYSQYTDLDVLLSRLDDSERSGENYENLLLVADIMGPAAEAQAQAARAPSPPVGRVEVLRRRTTRDGRVKLKLVLLGVSVDRCGICLSQFKDGQPAALGTRCQHAFHDHCMSRWLVRNRTCPLCRAPFE